MYPNRHLPLLVGASLALAATACGTSAMQTDAPSTGRQERPNEAQRDAKPPVPKRNPNPTAYEITMTIENAPGPFGVVEGVMQYETALNDPCLPRLGGMAGTRMRLKERIPVRFEKAGDGRYRGIVQTDLLVDEDYFGLGVCRWTMAEARIELRATGNDHDTTFFDGLTPADIESETTQSFHFWSGMYPAAAPGGINQPGQSDPTKFNPDAREDLFKVTLSTRKLAR